MSDYRISLRNHNVAMHGDVYIVQRKVIFVWLDVLNCWDRPQEFPSVKAAEDAIKEWKQQKDVVVKEV